MLKFEWDSAKAEANSAKHGVTFDEAKEAFADLAAFVRQDTRFDYGEDRFILIGLAGWRYLTVVFTERGGKLRLISARPASRKEIEFHGFQSG